MRLRYGIARNLDYIAALLRSIGLHRITRLGRDIIAEIFPHGITIEIDGHHLCGSIRDRAFLYKVKERRFEPETLEAFSDSVQPGMTVLDIGAYLGYFALLAARLVGPQGKVYAFEPDPFSYRLLEHNIHLNGYGNVIPVSKAVSKDRRAMKLFQHASDPTMTSLLARNGWGKAISVETISLDEFLGDQKIDAVKMDVEGAELYVLQGMVETAARSPSMTLFIELNPRSLSEGGSSEKELCEQIRKMGFQRIIRLDEQRDSYGNVELCNLMCQR